MVILIAPSTLMAMQSYHNPMEGKGMWGARRRKSDEDYYPSQSPIEPAEMTIEDAMADIDSQSPPFTGVDIDMDTIGEYILQAEEALKLMEQFIRSPECTPEYITALISQMAPELYNQPEFQSILQQLPDKRTLRRTLRDGVVFGRKLLKDLPDVMEQASEDNLLQNPEAMIEHFTNLITPEMANSLSTVMGSLQPHFDIIHDHLMSVLDEDTMDLLRPLIDTMFTSVKGRGSESTDGGASRLHTSESIKDSVINLLSNVKSPEQMEELRRQLSQRPSPVLQGMGIPSDVVHDQEEFAVFVKTLLTDASPSLESATTSRGRQTRRGALHQSS